MTYMKLRITPAIQVEFENPITDALANQKRGTPDPSDGIYLKVHAAMEAKGRGKAVTIDADEADVQELTSRAEYEVGPNGVCAENITYSYEFQDRAYWLGRKRAYTALLNQIKNNLAAARH